VIKDRIKKSYRLAELDEKIRKRRTKSEAKLFTKASQIIDSPIPQESKNKYKIKMPFINGEKLSEHLDNFPLSKQKQICKQIGESIAKLHNSDIIHGDLTTSNMILKDNKIFFIDFGLGEFSKRIETQATDLSVLKEAFKSTHFKHLNLLWDSFIKGYKQTNDNFNKVLDNLKDIEKRGRYVRRNE